MVEVIKKVICKSYCQADHQTISLTVRYKFYFFITSLNEIKDDWSHNVPVRLGRRGPLFEILQQFWYISVHHQTHTQMHISDSRANVANKCQSLSISHRLCSLWYQQQVLMAARWKPTNTLKTELDQIQHSITAKIFCHILAIYWWIMMFPHTNSKCYWQQAGNQPILPKLNWIKHSTHHYSQNMLSHIGHVVVNDDVPTNQQEDVLTGLRFTFQDLDIWSVYISSLKKRN